MQYAPTRVYEKFGWFHISPPGYTKNAPDFTLPNKDTPKTRPVLDPNHRRRTFRGVCFCAPTWVRAKPARFHISAPEYTKNTPGFTLSNKDTPKPRPVLAANSCRRTFRGVCFCAPTRVHQKTDGFWTQTVGERLFGAYAFAPLHVYVQNPPDFIFPHTGTPKTHLFSPFPIGIDPKPTRF